MSLTTITWNRQFSDSPQPATLMGMPGWWTLPRSWFTRSHPGGSNQLLASETEDFLGKVYTCVILDDGITYGFQDPLRDKLNGLEP
jgi:hypothetical protein